MNKPQETDLQATRNILRYLKGTINYGILYSVRSEEGLITFIDADFGRDPDTQRSVAGIIHQFAGAPIHWSSNLQDTIIL